MFVYSLLYPVAMNSSLGTAQFTKVSKKIILHLNDLKRFQNPSNVESRCQTGNTVTILVWVISQGNDSDTQFILIKHENTYTLKEFYKEL